MENPSKITQKGRPSKALITKWKETLRVPFSRGLSAVSALQVTHECIQTTRNTYTIKRNR